MSPFRTLLRAAKFIPARLFRPNALLPPMVSHFCLNGASISLRPSPVAAVCSVPPSIMRSRLACLATTDVRPALPRIATPALYLRASDDRVVSARLGLEMTSLLPNVKVVEIDGPHLLLQTRPRECAAEIMQFVATR